MLYGSIKLVVRELSDGYFGRFAKCKILIPLFTPAEGLLVL